jgi:hypothetical protein
MGSISELAEYPRDLMAAPSRRRSLDHAGSRDRRLPPPPPFLPCSLFKRFAAETELPGLLCGFEVDGYDQLDRLHTLESTTAELEQTFQPTAPLTPDATAARIPAGRPSGAPPFGSKAGSDGGGRRAEERLHTLAGRTRIAPQRKKGPRERALLCEKRNSEPRLTTVLASILKIATPLWGSSPSRLTQRMTPLGSNDFGSIFHSLTSSSSSVSTQRIVPLASATAILFL